MAQISHTYTTPKSFYQVANYPNWRAAVKAEFDALLMNQTWDLIPWDPDQNVVACKRLFRIKRKPDRKVDRY